MLVGTGPYDDSPLRLVILSGAKDLLFCRLRLDLNADPVQQFSLRSSPVGHGSSTFLSHNHL